MGAGIAGATGLFASGPVVRGSNRRIDAPGNFGTGFQPVDTAINDWVRLLTCGTG